METYRFMYPDKLLSNHFWTEDQVEAFRLLKAKQSEEVFKNLIEDMKENSQELVKFLDNLHSKVECIYFLTQISP